MFESVDREEFHWGSTIRHHNRGANGHDGGSAYPGELPVGEDDQMFYAEAVFRVDNGSCGSAKDVYLDGVLVGHVSPGETDNFNSWRGTHHICIISAGDDYEQTCPDLAEIKTMVHDGLSISSMCEEPFRGLDPE